MTDKAKRQISQNSLDNLKLGSQSQDKGKQRHNFTVLPETVQWLKDTGNASNAIDVLVDAAKTKGLLSNSTHAQKEQPTVNTSSQKIQELEQSLSETYEKLQSVRSQLKAEKELNESLQLQLAAESTSLPPQENLTPPLSELSSSQLDEVTNLLKQAITPKDKGGVYVRNAGKGSREVTQQALNLLTQTTQAKS